MDRVCARCFEDPDIQHWIADGNGPRGCDACRRHDSPTATLEDLGDFLRNHLTANYGNAEDDLPRDNESESGWFGTTWDTYDLLEELGVFNFRRVDGGVLDFEIANVVGVQRTWCEWDWTSLSLDEKLSFNWRRFCEIIKHHRRFFFHALVDPDDREDQSPAELLQFVAKFADRQKLVRSFPAGSQVFRARPETAARSVALTAAELGPPPANRALQANRMNPAGIPMMYVANHQRTALAEIRARHAAVGRFEFLRDARILDLTCMPAVPGFFSDADRHDRLSWKFLHSFRDAITEEVDRTDAAHIDYLPSQVATEFFRDFDFTGGLIDGIAYPSVVDNAGTNLVLFASQRDVVDASSATSRNAWIRFEQGRHIRSAPRRR